MSNGNPMFGIRGKTTKTNYNDEDEFRGASTQHQTQGNGNPLVNPNNVRSKFTPVRTQEQTQIESKITNQKQETIKSTSDFTILNNVNAGTVNYNNNNFISYPKAQPTYRDIETDKKFNNYNKFQTVESQAGLKELYVAVLRFCVTSKRNGDIERFKKSSDNSWEIYISGGEYESVLYFCIDSNNNKNTIIELKRLSGFGGFSFGNLTINLKEYLINEKLVENENDNNNNNNDNNDETKEEEPQFGFFAPGYDSSDDESDTE